MKLVAFLQLRNELESGNLTRCLENCRRWADDIFIYDDCSTDGSQSVYENYTLKKNIIFAKERDFKSELFHKQQLLDLALTTSPDWIGWIDGDTILDRKLTNDCKTILKGITEDYLSAGIHNINMWRHPAYYRADSNFHGPKPKCIFWRASNLMHFRTKKKLHQEQSPLGYKQKMYDLSNNYLLHYGFASYESIVRKYLMYKSLGQSGWLLDRLIDEQTAFDLRHTEKEWFPVENIPKDFDLASKPKPLTYNEIRKFNNWEEYKREVG
jgi:glycosyltransferase involved in cell wall biosynthesis